ncbi:hypothetical protein ACQCVE_02430 [Metabacillus sp. 113a]|uniref:hypothetical protein n=1 Tax=Metabacillus sp. 113a TaxID=3404706 RepID=UPI003CF7AFED
MDGQHLLECYRRIWHNRRLDSRLPPEEALEDALMRDLLDEGTHPRVRKSITDKYALSVSRVQDSLLQKEEKNELIIRYNTVMNRLLNH